MFFFVLFCFSAVTLAVCQEICTYNFYISAEGETDSYLLQSKCFALDALLPASHCAPSGSTGICLNDRLLELANNVRLPF
uniref:Putative secreted protein salivary gland overexpressed n=1 Tax=Rhipicephalus microplus TaxID=6941 RepID=A0A6M2DAF6_RHIMP